MRKQNSNQGITLIVLVITIIVLLILAAVSISAIVGENGIVSKSKKAENDTIEGEEQEFVELAYSSVLVDATTKGMTDEEQKKGIEEELKKLAGDNAVTVENNGDSKLTVKFTETGNEYEIELDNLDYTTDDKGYTQKDIDETLKYFTFDESTGVLTSKEEMIGPYTARTFPLNVAVFPKEINGVPVEGIESFEGLGLLAGSKELEKVIILSEIQTIGDWDYYGCTNLKSIELPDSVTSIGANAFSDCTSLTNVYYAGTEEEWNAINIIDFNNNALTNATITYGEGAIIGYTQEDIDNTLKYFTFDESTGVLTSKEEMIGVYGDGNRDIPLKVAVFPKEINGVAVTAIESHEGMGLLAHSKYLKKVIILAEITEIGENDYYACTSLISIELPSSLTSIESFAFFGCTGLTNVYYTGTQAEWNEISIDSSNTALTNATITYNYVK